MRPSTFSWYTRSEEHTSELQSRRDLVCRLLLEKQKQTYPFVLGRQPANSPLHPYRVRIATATSASWSSPSSGSGPPVREVGSCLFFTGRPPGNSYISPPPGSPGS